MDAHRVLPRSGYSRSRPSTGSSAAVAEGNQEIRPRAKRPPRTRSGEPPDADAREIERLARRVEQHSQRMADLLRRGVLEPSLAYAFLMTKGGQQVPVAKTKAKGPTRGRAPANEGAVIADVSPPRLPPERPPTASASTARPKVRISRRSRVKFLSSAERRFAWSLHKADKYNSRSVVFFAFEQQRLHGPCARKTRTIPFLRRLA